LVVGGTTTEHFGACQHLSVHLHPDHNLVVGGLVWGNNERRHERIPYRTFSKFSLANCAIQMIP
jgi:hypothetical protein